MRRKSIHIRTAHGDERPGVHAAEYLSERIVLFDRRVSFYLGDKRRFTQHLAVYIVRRGEWHSNQFNGQPVGKLQQGG